MDEEFEPIEKLGTVQDLLDGLSVKYEVHRHDEGEFSYLNDDEVSIKIQNPFTDRTVFIDFQDEISLYFGMEWHEHYYPNSDCFDEFLETLAGLLKNGLCSAAVFVGDDRHWCCSTLSSKVEISEKSAEEVFSEPCPRPGEAEELRHSWEEKGAEVHFLFWDPAYDKIVIYEKR